MSVALRAFYVRETSNSQVSQITPPRLHGKIRQNPLLRYLPHLVPFLLHVCLIDFSKVGHVMRQSDCYFPSFFSYLTLLSLPFCKCLFLPEGIKGAVCISIRIPARIMSRKMISNRIGFVNLIRIREIREVEICGENSIDERLTMKALWIARRRSERIGLCEIQHQRNRGTQPFFNFSKHK